MLKGTSRGLTHWVALGQAGLGSDERGDFFASALAAGDFNNDGRAELAVGAPGEKIGTSPSGHAFSFRGQSAGLSAWQSLSQ